MKIEYNNLYTHLIFTTKNRRALIKEKHRTRIEKCMTGVVNKNGCRLYSIYANPKHVHLIISRAPNISEEEIAAIITNSAQKFINQNNLCHELFEWQQTASAFSVSKTDVDKVCKYILNQPKHHQKISFSEKYELLLKHYQTGTREIR